MKKLILSLMIAGVLTGCASFPEHYEKPAAQTDVTKQMQDAWSAIPSISYLKSNTGLAVRKFNKIPEGLAKTQVKVLFHQGAGATVDDLLYALQQQGVRVASRLEKSKDKELNLVNYSGNLGKLLDDLATFYNLSYEYRNGVIFMTETARYAVAMPQYDGLMKKVEEALKAMGANDVRPDVQAGQVYYEASADNAQEIAEYLEVIGKNSAMVTLQIAVLTVSHNRDVALGFDWAQVMASRGSGGMAPSMQKDATSTDGGTVPLGSLLSFTGGSGLAYKFTNDAFSLTAAIKALSTYGEARTDQNVVLGTVSGLPVKISSGNDIPYVKSVGAATTSGGSTSGSTETAIVNSGLKVEVTPNFDANDRSVTTKVNVDMSSLVGFRELKAGTQVGSLSQPEIQKLTFENVGRLAVGETLVVGGISYDQLSNNYTNLPGMESAPTGSKSDKVNRHSIYIVIRPTVVAFVPDAPKRQAEKRIESSAKESSANKERVEVVDGVPVRFLPPVEATLPSKPVKPLVKPVAKVKAPAKSASAAKAKLTQVPLPPVKATHPAAVPVPPAAKKEIR